MFNFHPRHTMQLLMQLEEHLPEMDDAQLKKYRKLCRSLSIEPKPLQCIKQGVKDKSSHGGLRKKE